MKLQIEKLVFGGQGIAHADGQTFFVWNALPGEVVEAEITKKRKGIREAVATDIVTPSPDRVTPEEDHFLSCSPWQIMPLATEHEQKVKMAQETYEYSAGLQFTEPLQIFHAGAEYGYRNKMEFSFWETDDGVVHLSLFERGKKTRTPIEECVLAEEVINSTAHIVLNWVREQRLGRRDLKTLIVRSNGQGKAIAALFLKEKKRFGDYPTFTHAVEGFTIYYSTHKSPASVPTELMYQKGNDFLMSRLLNAELKCGLLGFFQVNIPVFEAVLIEIQQWLPANADIVDFYSGVGAISIPLAASIRSAVLVDNNEEAIAFATENIRLNQLPHYTAHCATAEQMIDEIKNDRIILLDPPRAGLHGDVTQRILDVAPQRLIYLSCNPSTQARDIALLKEKYKVTFLKLYNFFPRTPHIEALCILDRL